MRTSAACATSVLLVAFAFGGRTLSAQVASIEGVVTAPGEPAAGAVVFLVPHVRSGELRPDSTAVIDQVGLRFVPPLLVVTPGTIVSFHNSDPILHNIFSPQGPGSGFDLGTYPRGEERSHTFGEAGAHVVLCNVHPEMVAYVLVVDTTLYAVVGDGGRFRLDDVPVGRYALRVWHPSAGSTERNIVLGNGDLLRVMLLLPPVDR